MQQQNKGNSAESMYDATGALKIKTLGGGASGVNSKSSEILFINVEKNPFQQRRGT
jgi:hypothetical protein